MSQSLRMTEEQYEEHQKKVKQLTPRDVLREIERAATWTQHKDPRVQAGGRVVIDQFKALFSMESLNRHHPSTGLNGEKYDSKSEARRHQVLLMREHAGIIRDLKHKPARIPLVVAGVEIGTWTPDFQYHEATDPSADRAAPPWEPGWQMVWEDVKGFTQRKTTAGKLQVNPAWRAFKFKAKVIGALYPEVAIRVITRDKILV